MKIVTGGIIALFLAVNMSASVAQIHNGSLEETAVFSTPQISEENGCSTVVIPEANGVMTKDGCPMLPVFSKTFEFPLGAQITSLEVQPSTIQTISVGQQVRPVPTKQMVGDQIVPVEGFQDEAVYGSSDAYPASWYTSTFGAGLNTKNEHTLFVTIRITPARYFPATHLLQFSTEFSIHMTYLLPEMVKGITESYPLVIITPSSYVDLLQPLMEHKINHGLPTKLVSLDEIYSSYVGRDNPERIKYFIRSAVETWGTLYVLLIGDIKALPIRTTFTSWFEPTVLSDQYYADIYDAQGHFCSWDANGNNRFSETNENGDDLDGVDLYADVHVGRLACADATEVTTLVGKIISYEDETYNQIWFKRIILAGGDTFPLLHGAPPFVYEGEITNVKVGQELAGFDQTYLWTSKHTLQPWTFNQAINKGAGFVSYAGHGFEYGWSTYRPNQLLVKQPIWYFMPFINGLKNQHKLPIIFFDACLTAKLDFNISDLVGYVQSKAYLLARIFHLSEDPSDFYTCFGWYFVQKPDGGAIATIGATRTAYTWVDADGVYGGAGYLDVHFFKAYHDGTTLGPMLTSAQNDYISNVGKDCFTIEEFMLLGDPSMMVGGYP